MWFAIGLVSLGVLLFFQFRFRWITPWSGLPGVLPRTPVHHYRYRKSKDSYVGIEVAVRVPDFFRFELKRERWTDRFFKWVGLSVEKQFGHHGFDRLVYVASDDAHLLNRVADSPELREAAQLLFSQAAPGCKIRRVQCAHGWLVLRIDRSTFLSHKEDARRLEQAMSAALPSLDRIGVALRASERPVLPPARRDPYLLPAVAVLSVSTALAINGALFLIRPVLFDDAFLLDTTRIIELAFWVGSFIFAGLLGAYLILLARSARAHLFLLELLLVGSFGAYGSAASEIRDANIEWDSAPAVMREAPVVDKSISRSRRGGTSHFLHVANWKGGTDTLRIKVSRSFYEATARGRLLVFEERPGRFKAAWARLVGARPAPSAPT
ncbi:hypothetical protein ACLIJR_06185 [Hydrogenophaga sp. XSHU_21]